MPQPTTTGGALMGYPTTVDTGQVQPQIIDNEVASYTLNTSALSANTVYLWAFELLTNVTITGMRFRNGTTATGATNLGIYTAAGNLIAGSDTGAQTDAVSTTKTATYGSPVVLGPGQYFLALACNNATDTFNALILLSRMLHAQKGQRTCLLLARCRQPPALLSSTPRLRQRWLH